MKFFRRLIARWFSPVPSVKAPAKPLPEYIRRHMEAQDRGDFEGIR